MIIIYLKNVIGSKNIFLNAEKLFKYFDDIIDHLLRQNYASIKNYLFKIRIKNKMILSYK
jgi:hypothetical protein